MGCWKVCGKSPEADGNAGQLRVMGASLGSDFVTAVDAGLILYQRGAFNVVLGADARSRSRTGGVAAFSPITLCSFSQCQSAKGE
jgi:hypothetical protein